MVRSSTFARLILISPAMTKPLSRTRSRMSTNPCDREGFTSSGNWGAPFESRRLLTQPAQRSEIDIQILVGQPEDRLELVHTAIQLKQRQAETFDLFFGQRASVHPANGLMLQHFP